jgi:hypothetical protein
MRKMAFVIGTLIWTSAYAGAAAPYDPYQWCAEYSGGYGGSTNCYFLTNEQCRAAISGDSGAFCRPNGFATVRPPEPPRKPRANRRPS